MAFNIYHPRHQYHKVDLKSTSKHSRIKTYDIQPSILKNSCPNTQMHVHVIYARLTSLTLLHHSTYASMYVHVHMHVHVIQSTKNPNQDLITKKSEKC